MTSVCSSTSKHSSTEVTSVRSLTTAPPPAAAEIAGEISAELACVGSTIAEQRAVRKVFSGRLRTLDASVVVATAMRLLDGHRWVGYELVYHHPTALGSLTAGQVEALGDTFDGWGAVDAFGRYISGPAWRIGAIEDDLIRSWTTSDDRWWRRAALVSTVPLNLPSAGGTGDTARTIDICERLVADRDDMVVKALSWALRQLAHWDSDAVRAFLDRHETAARVRREVTSKLETGLKSPRSAGR